MDSPSKALLQRKHCWFGSDRVPDRPAVTAFKQTARLQQAAWREKRDWPIGTSPYDAAAAKDPAKVKPVGSRLEHAFAWRTRANLISEGAGGAAARRAEEPQQHEMLSWDRLWCDLLSSMPLCFNVFGPLSVDLELAQRAVSAWFPDAPGVVSDVVLEWSPERRGERFLGNGTAFDAAIILALPEGRRGVIGIETKYHEHLGPELAPRAELLTRYTQVANRSKVFRRGTTARVVGEPLQQVWQDHLLALSMVQQRDDNWDWARFVVVHPSRNPSFAQGLQQYEDLLKDHATFRAVTLESLLGNPKALPAELTEPLRERYLW